MRGCLLPYSHHVGADRGNTSAITGILPTPDRHRLARGCILDVDGLLLPSAVGGSSWVLNGIHGQCLGILPFFALTRVERVIVGSLYLVPRTFRQVYIAVTLWGIDSLSFR